MKTIQNRPIFLNLIKIHFPVSAVVSILHRVSGVLLSLSIPVLVFLFGLSIKDEQSYSRVADWLTGIGGKLIVVFLLWNLAHHFLAGIRFLLLDLDIGITKIGAARSAWVVHVGAAIIALIVLGVMI